MSIAVIEKLVKKSGIKLTRLESKGLIVFNDELGKFFCGYGTKGERITFYFQPLYDQPAIFKTVKLKKFLKGKSCLHFKNEEQIDTDLIINLLEIAKRARS